jgi:hypothetical protein
MRFLGRGGFLMRALARFACLCALAALPVDPARAQDGAAFDYDPAAADGARLSWFSGLLLRGDWARDLPLNLPDEQRALARLRAGLLWLPDDAWQVAAALEASRGSDSPQVVRVAHDNYRTNDLNVDLLYAKRRFGEHGAVTLGKQPLPLELTPMVWDPELRPVGVGFEHGVATGDFDRLVFAGGAWAGDQWGGDASRLFAAQVGWRLREGAPTSGSALLSYLVFDDLDDLVRSGLARSNRRVAGRLASDFRLLDLQVGFDTRVAGAPLRARVDVVRNLGADAARDGARGSVVWGDARDAGALELGLSYQRVQRDAVMAAFNSEDWWFHSAMRGVMPWVGYGIDDTWRVQLALFLERADGRAEDTERALLDLRADW